MHPALARGGAVTLCPRSYISLGSQIEISGATADVHCPTKDCTIDGRGFTRLFLERRPNSSWTVCCSSMAKLQDRMVAHSFWPRAVAPIFVIVCYSRGTCFLSRPFTRSRDNLTKSSTGTNADWRSCVSDQLVPEHSPLLSMRILGK